MAIDEKAFKVAMEAFNRHLSDGSPLGVVRTTIQAYESAKASAWQPTVTDCIDPPLTKKQWDYVVAKLRPATAKEV